MNYEELLEENARLRRKLSPLEDTDFTAKLAVRMGALNLSDRVRKFRRGKYVVITPREVAELCGLSTDMPTLTNIGRSLQAMCWERSALNGNLVFVMSVEEYQNGLQ